MSKKDEATKHINIEQTVMSEILSGRVRMKPKWYFVAGSILSVLGLAGLVVTAVFCLNLLLFLIRKRGPGFHRLELMLDSFPLWVPLLAIASIGGGIIMLKRFDFSYKKSYKTVVLGFILSVLFAAYAIDVSGLSELWFKRGPAKYLRQTGPKILR